MGEEDGFDFDELETHNNTNNIQRFVADSCC